MYGCMEWQISFEYCGREAQLLVLVDSVHSTLLKVINTINQTVLKNTEQSLRNNNHILVHSLG